jgi:CubicO group peptidase (beta-lactamase class C family)
MRYGFFLLFAMVAYASPAFCQAEQKIDSFVSKAMSDWHTMGVAVAIVSKDSILLQKGYGYSNYARRLPVTPNTLFPIASCSKTFVAGLLGMAAAEGRIQLNKPVHNYLPAFNLSDKEVTKRATVEDLLSHRTGLPGHDWAWTFNTNFPESVYLNRIRHLEPSAALGTKYQYNNFMFFVLSVLVEKVYHKNWNEVVREKLFVPLEMKHSYGSYATSDRQEPRALTYEYKDSFRLDETRQMDDLLGAGSINTTAGDLAHWLQLWISGGTYKKKYVLPSTFIQQATSSHIVVEAAPPEIYPDEQFMNMGLSWFLSSYRGHYKAHHTGNVAGYSSSLTFFPYDSLGIVVLTNQNNSPLIRLLPDVIADLFFHYDLRDKNSALLTKQQAYAKQKVPDVINIDTVEIQKSFTPAVYCGHFYNPGYGPVRIEPYKKVLLLTYYDLKLALIPKGKGHCFSSHYVEDKEVYTDGVGDVVFDFDKGGHLLSFSIPFEPAVRDIVFRKKN